MLRRCTYSSFLSVLFTIFLSVLIPLSAFAQEADEAKKTGTGGTDETVSIKILAVNPSDARLNTVVTHRLPPEVQPEHIVEKGTLELKYDSNLVAYYVTTTINLDARETRALTIKVKNVWRLDMEYLEKVRITLQQTVSALTGTRYQETAERLFEKVNEQLDRIEEEQVAPKGIQQQIELFRSHMKQLKQIENGVMSLSALRKLANQAETGIRTVKFIIRARNPADERKTMNVRALLPKEITSFDVINKLDFNLLFDDDESRFVVEKADIFDPKEEMKYEIILRDVWYITKDELDFFREQAAKIMERFTGTSYENFAQQTIDFIVQTLDDIWILQEEVQESEAIEDRIRAFVINNQRLELVKRKMKELQDLLLEIPVRRMTEVDQIREAINELSKVFDIMSLGFTPDLSTTWWIILGIILFLFVFSASFYITWVIELGKSKWGQIKKKEKKAKKDKKTAETASP